MAYTQGEDDFRVDLGGLDGPSTAAPLQAHIRIRPTTIRFTEPGVHDLTLRLHSLLFLRHPPSSSSSASSANQPKDDILFDFDSEDQQTTSATHGGREVREIITTLSEAGVMGDESVRLVKARMAQSRDAVKGRRLRLIHAGRVLRDGVRLVGYLEELDARQRAQARQTLRHLALDNDNDDGDSEDEEDAASDAEEEADQVEKREMSVRELIDFLAAQGSEDGEGENNSSSVDKGKGKGKSREPAFYDDVVRVTIRTAPKVYLQCSVGELETPITTTSTQQVPTSSLIDTGEAPAHDYGGAGDVEGSERRGFNRLLEAGLTVDEVESIRTQFRSTHPVHQPYDLIRSREHAAHLLEMEESWMDSFASTTNANAGLTEPGSVEGGGGGGGVYMTVMQGLMVGFFMPPLVPLFWFRDKPHPSSLPSGMAAAGGGAGEGEDDEEEWGRERTEETRESVFGSTMQISILFGVVANLTMGMFRFIW